MVLSGRELGRATVIAMTVFAAGVRAQTTGAIEGHVVDAVTGRPVAHVVVVATCPVLPRGQTTVSDSDGAYMLALLPAGIYQLRASHDAYADEVLNGVEVLLDRTSRTQLSLTPA